MRMSVDLPAKGRELWRKLGRQAPGPYGAAAGSRNKSSTWLESFDPAFANRGACPVRVEGGAIVRETQKGLFPYRPLETVKSSQYWFHVDHEENWILQ